MGNVKHLKQQFKVLTANRFGAVSFDKQLHYHKSHYPQTKRLLKAKTQKATQR